MIIFRLTDIWATLYMYVLRGSVSTDPVSSRICTNTIPCVTHQNVLLAGLIYNYRIGVLQKFLINCQGKFSKQEILALAVT
jgi:hypothetical protein